MRGRLISPENLELKCWKLGVVLDSPQTVWVACVIIYAINYGLGVAGRKWPWISVPQSGTDAW